MDLTSTSIPYTAKDSAKKQKWKNEQKGKKEKNE